MGTRKITEEELLSYVSGQASLEEMAEISLAIKEDPELQELISILEKMKDNGTLDEGGSGLPVSDCAGDGEDNLCDVQCESFILRDYLPEEEFRTILDDQEENVWKKESGTPLYNIGRMLEKYGMSVTRRYDCSIEDIISGVQARSKMIAVVDSGRLWTGISTGAFHAVVCLAADADMLTVYEPASDNIRSYDIKTFEKSWKSSHNYLVTASAEGLEYMPHPINVCDMGLDEDLVELTEALAEDAHEVWASAKKAEGWTHGPARDDRDLQHPDLVPYSELPEREKQYDRDSATHTLRLVKKLGFNIRRNYTLYCPGCGEFVGEEMNFCPNCGRKLDWKHF